MIHLDRLDLVKIGKQTENHFIGVNSGIIWDNLPSVWELTNELFISIPNNLRV